MTSETMRRCYFLIGLQKTGTSYLQSVLWGSRDELRRQGVELLPGSKDATFNLMLSLLGRRRRHPEAARGQALQELAGAAQRSDAERVIVSEESLSAATTEQAAALVDAVPGFEPHVVVSVRDVARQLPSVWQQKVKAGRELGFSKFLEDIVARRPAADPFWAYQDLPEVLRRWRRVVPAERIHVVTVPRQGSPSDLLLERFCSVVGVRADDLVERSARSNAALGREQVELLRQVNAATSPAVRRERGFGRTRKFYLAGLLAEQEGQRPRAPETMRDWCAETAEEQIQELVAGGYDLVGNTEDLLPTPAAFSTVATDEPDAAAVVQSAARAISQMLVDRDADRTEIRQLRRRAEALSQRPTSDSLLARLRRRVRRVNR